MKNIRDFKGVWIPKRIWLNTELTIMEKLFLVEIDSLDNSQGCYASNDHFSEFFGLSKKRCSAIIKDLEDKGYVSIFYHYKEGTKSIEKRVVRCTKKMYSENEFGCLENATGVSRKCDRGVLKMRQGCLENAEDNNTLSNTSSNTNKDNVEQSSHIEQSSTLVEKSPVKFHFEIVSYLNEICGTSYRVSSKKTQQLINARLKEGFTVEDFKVVIYKMNLEWRNDKKMHAYLRPETLFGPKFEGYLNRKEKEMTLNDVDIEIDYDNLWG